MPTSDGPRVTANSFAVTTDRAKVAIEPRLNRPAAPTKLRRMNPLSVAIGGCRPSVTAIGPFPSSIDHRRLVNETLHPELKHQQVPKYVLIGIVTPQVTIDHISYRGRSKERSRQRSVRGHCVE